MYSPLRPQFWLSYSANFLVKTRLYVSFYRYIWIEGKQDHLLFVTKAMPHPDAKVSIVNLCQATNLY
jgi:hypothetical protein